jgi:hypothetical protein
MISVFRDLSFKKNDLINLRKQVDDNWYHGELNGQQGFFPASYVQVGSITMHMRETMRVSGTYLISGFWAEKPVCVPRESRLSHISEIRQ